MGAKGIRIAVIAAFIEVFTLEFGESLERSFTVISNQ